MITAHGLTDPFDVRTSVRQGDPLAPLLYILFLDVLHRGLDADPGGPVEGSGYTMSTGDHTRVASCGYADDLLAFAESARAAERMHEWTRTFFGMHATRINAKKTKYFCSAVRSARGVLTIPHPTMVADLRSVCGHTRIAPRPTSTSFRYLGVMLSPDLDWTDELARLNSIVWSARSSILNYRMRFLPAADAVRSYVVPRMEAGLQTIGLSARVMATLDRWTGLLQSAVLVAHSSYDPGVCRAAFCFVSGMPCLSLSAKSLRAVSLYQRLCLDSRSLPRTTADRIAAVSAAGSLSEALSTRHPPRDARAGGHLRWNRSAAALWGEHRLPLSLAWNEHYVEPSVAIPCDARPVADSALEEVRIDWDPRRPPDRLFSTAATRSYDVFTDGSTPRDGGAVSGYAAVIYDSSDLGLDPVVLGSYLKCSGNNFLAEMCALVAALMAVPAQATVRIFSDSLACIQAVCRDDTAAKRRIRAAARPMLTSLRRLMASRPGRVSFHHVRAHTGGSDFASVANDLADRRANEERTRAAALGVWGKPYLYNEEQVIPYITWPQRTRATHVIGDVGAACREWAYRQLYLQWSDPALTRQGRTARASSYAETLQLCRVIRRHQDSDAMHDLLLALCEWFPSGRSHGRGRTGPARTLLGDQWACPTCSEPGDETCSHVLMCEATAPARWNLACRIDDLLAEGLSISLSFSTPSARYADEVFDIASKATRDAAPRPVALRRLVDLVSTRDRTLTGGRCCPRGSALAVSRAICTAGCPCSRAHMSGAPCPAPVSESMAGALRRALLLDTCIFSSSRHLLPGYARWASYHPLDDHAGSLGVPWLVPWAGRFSLCAPWSPDDRTASRCLFRARGAVNSARPTRLALVLPPAAGARAARVGALCLCRRLPGCHDASLFLLQNAPANGLYPIDWTALREAGCLDDNFSPPASPSYVPTSCAPRLRWGLGIPAFADSMFLPFLNSSVPFKPPGLPPGLGDAFGYLVSHDRYAGLVGLLPACFASLMEWVFRESGCCVKEAVALANCRADSVRLQLFLHAQRTLRAARRVRARWQDSLDGPAEAAREDVMAAGAHERDRKRRDAEFSRAALRARDKARFVAQRRIACKALGIRTVRQLMGLFPGWTCGTRPPETLAGALRAAEVASDPWIRGTRLRDRTRLRPYDDGSYVLLPVERRKAAGRRAGWRAR